MHSRYREIREKQQQLLQAGDQLKREFVGIDSVIDRVTNAVSAWWLFPDLQERPLIINLWGLTGVGKTSLIKRLSQLLDYHKKYYHFDLGHKEGRTFKVQSRLESIYERDNGYPVILALDEFQHARTLDRQDIERRDPAHRIIWQLLDTGRFQINPYYHGTYDIYELRAVLHKLILKGVEVQEGKVISQKRLFQEKMMKLNRVNKEEAENEDESNKKWNFIPSSYEDSIEEIISDDFIEEDELREHLNKLNAAESMRFIQQVLDQSHSPKEVDCSKCLIFVMGNLDEAYSMSHEFNPDMDADSFHEQSLKINIPEIKEALSHRFRSEQIARLGNVHIIYPALNRKAYEDLIEMNLERIRLKVLNSEKIDMRFHTSFRKLIYKEGVYPTMGTRPLFTTIEQMVNSRLGQIISSMMLQDAFPDQMEWRAEEDRIEIVSYREGEVAHTYHYQEVLPLSELRKEKRDDEQALVAVHESGHALLSCVLMRVIPRLVLSITAAARMNGFVHTQFPWKHIAKWEIRPRLAVILGGLAAEKLVFGEDRCTTGAESDLSRATSLIGKMLKEHGMGEVPASYRDAASPQPYRLRDRMKRVDSPIEQELLAAMTLAEETLKKYKKLLLFMADHLSEHRQLEQDEMKELLKKYAPDIWRQGMIENADQLYYRSQLKQQVSMLKERRAGKPYAPTILEDHLLNKDSETLKSQGL